ncbi:hypothetical protein AOXY_G28080 [Acipenser oxyrinchus oxyrinchus]|uniref:Fibronectin type-III domain-containing protein n=1 Tax=Acipenser oxyrinchus oxyrinchus TaxID=40147 RepID=A0AAD8CQL9_ACIOX|nr:hypothetical protein AOXY_G28080 [Acipenser oxyrinchus oxyrinchus]
MDSPFNDSIVGNNIGNFLSCSGGTDYLQGKEGSDLYVIKSECQMVNINNNATDQKTDILFLPFAYNSLNLLFGSNRLTIASSESIYPTIHLLQWDAGDQWRHMLIKTADGITAHLPDNITEWQTSSKPVAIEIVVTTNETCQISAITYNLNDEKWQNVIRFQGLSDACSYTIKGNTLDNYIDPGPSHSQMLQTMEGGPGSDTYVMKYGYGLYNEINNFALDRKMDRLLLHMLYNEITISLSPPSVTIRCNSKSSFLQVVLFNYLKGDEYRHLEIHSADGYVFTINLVEDPYKNVTEINLSLSQVSQKLLLAKTKEFSALKSVHGSLLFLNLINSTTDFIHIVGGTQDDILIASGNKQIIEGLGGHDEIIGGPDNDIILGGNGNDLISAGNGDDLIYPGNGMDIVDGGPGKDTLLFSGNASTGRGVYVDLSMGIGLYCDAEGDTYTNVEAVKGTEFDDVLIGDMANNELYGHFGDDTLITRDGGQDLLFGGPGHDTYVLDFNIGTVIIQNFALDLALDTVLINSAAWEDTCFFLMEGFLHVKVRHFDPLLVLSGQDQLLIVIENYQRNTTCRHIQFLFANETQIGENEFENAVNVQEIIDYFNSTNVDLIFNSLNETSLNITFTSNNQPSSFTDLYNSMLVLANENKDVDISSNINPGEPRLITNLQSGVLYTISINVLKCGVPIAASPSLLVRTKPQPPLNLTIVAISFDSIELTWSHPQSDTNPNWEHYKYTVKVNGLNKWYTIEVGTNITETRIANLELNTTYGIAIMSTIDGINSMFSDMIHTRTENKCKIAITNGFIENIKMTAVGPVALIACNYGYVLRQPHEVLCPTEAVEMYSCDPSSCSDGSSFISHGTSRDKVCFGIKITSRCYFGKWSSPIPFCCEDIPFLSGGLTHFILDSNNSFQVKYSCLHGYALSGPFQRLCAAHERSHWIPQLEIATKCNPVSCPSLPHVPNGLYQTKGMTRYPLQPHYGEKFLQNDVVFLKCDTYYHSSIDQDIRCDNGNWIGEWGTCLSNVRLNSIEKNNFSLKANIEVFLNGFWRASICVEPKDFCQGSIFLSQTDFENLGKIACRSEGMELDISRQTRQPSTVTCHQLRLINTATAYEGQVEYYHEESSRWESACFPRMLANIICRILGMGKSNIIINAFESLKCMTAVNRKKHWWCLHAKRKNSHFFDCACFGHILTVLTCTFILAREICFTNAIKDTGQ